MTIRVGNITADGNYCEGVQSPSAIISVDAGNFGGGTLKAQFQDQAGTWRDFGTEASWTVGPVNIEILGSRSYRLNMAGATSPTVYAEVDERKKGKG